VDEKFKISDPLRIDSNRFESESNMTVSRAKRHAIILFDIDDTLINFQKSLTGLLTHQDEIIWNGGVETWRKYLKILQNVAVENNRQIYIGIATFKPTFNTDPFHKNNLMYGDVLSATVLEDEKYIQRYPYIKNLKTGAGLKEFIDPALVYFTNGECKTKVALKIAKNVIEEKYLQEIEGNELAYQFAVDSDDKVNLTLAFNKNHMSRNDVLICDDQASVCNEAERHAYSAVCVGNLSSLQHSSQIARIAMTFKNIFEKLELPVPEQIWQDTKSEVSEITKNPETQAITPAKRLAAITPEELQITEAEPTAFKEGKYSSTLNIHSFYQTDDLSKNKQTIVESKEIRTVLGKK
jgi:hypothetical protein